VRYDAHMKPSQHRASALLFVSVCTLAAVLTSNPSLAQTAITPTPTSGGGLSPDLFVALCALGAAISLGLQHALQAGNWPPGVTLSPMVRALVATLPGVGAVIFVTAQNSGHFDQHALAAGLMGAVGALQGLFTAWWPTASGSTPPAGSGS
jgi:hypothetical protein